jgi:hypothetical protein
VLSGRPTTVGPLPLRASSEAAARRPGVVADDPDAAADRDRLADDADGFDDAGPTGSVTTRARRSPSHATRDVRDEDDDAELDAETQALPVDARLLERLKHGDGTAPAKTSSAGPAASPASMPPRIALNAASPARSTAAKVAPRNAHRGADDDDDDNDAAGSAEDFDAGTPTRALRLGRLSRSAGKDDDDPESDARAAELAVLQERAGELRAELANVLQRIATLEAAGTAPSWRTPGAVPEPAARTDGATTAAAARPTLTKATAVAPSVRSADSAWAAVGDSADGDSIDGASAEVDALDAGTLPRQAAVSLTRPASAATATVAAVSRATAAPTRAIADSLDDEAGAAARDVVGADKNDVDAGLPGADDDSPIPSDEGVSLAALQGLLGDDDVPGEAASTQVAAVAMPELIASDGGDVFDSFAESSLLPADDSPPRPGVIALVVEDARARERLRRHLDARFAEIVEFASAADAADSEPLPGLDALVFIRPATSASSREGFARLDARADRPPVLVVSPDPVFDTVAGVDLRLPLGHKASEVARQIVEGLERLGVRAAG